MRPIVEIAKKIGLTEDDLELHGKYIAKIGRPETFAAKSRKDNKLILISSVHPTPVGEGKTTISIGLVDALNKIGKSAILSLREPSMGPVFGKKGGATGAGKAQICPGNLINLHFTGDMHAITYANNLLCALIDNHLHQGNLLKINPKTITINRCLDVNDRVLRNIVIGLGKPVDGLIRQEHFNITAASEIMAVMCLSKNLVELRTRISNILIGFSFDGSPIFVKDLNLQGVVTAVLMEAFKPNLVQTLEGSPVLVHGGPFANIAHGCCSVIATKLAVSLSEFAVTEAGFGADLGAEKFFHIKCNCSDLKPNCVVLVVTIKALIHHGKTYTANCQTTGELNDFDFLKFGLKNLKAHVFNLKKFNVPTIVAINEFSNDLRAHMDLINSFCEKELSCCCEICNVFGQGGEGAKNLANTIVDICQKPVNFKVLYRSSDSLKNKIEKICTQIYGATHVNFAGKTLQQLELFERMGFSNFPICVCKSPYSFVPNKTRNLHSEDIEITFHDVKLASGAGFVVAFAENALTMPGLPKIPAANLIDVTDTGEITGIN